MRSWQLVIVFAFLFVCIGCAPKKYNWPKKETRYSSLEDAFLAVVEDGVRKAVIFVETDGCPACKEVKEYWEAFGNQVIPFYTVEANSPE